MTKLKFFQIATGALVILNICLLSVFLMGKEKKKGKQGPPKMERISEILMLDKEQERQFQQSIKVHHDQMVKLDLKHKKIMATYFVDLHDEENQANVDQLLAIERTKLEITKEHFKEIKSILNPDQVIHFKEFIKYVLPNRNRGNKQGPPPPNGPHS